MNLRDTIVRRLGELGWSQADLARAAGLPRQNLNALLEGRRPLTIRYLLVLDHALGLGLDYSRCLWPDAASVDKVVDSIITDIGG